MKKQSKLFLTCFFSLLLLLFIVGCEKEDQNTEKTIHGSNIVKKKIMFGEFATHSLAFNKLLDAENKLNNKTVYGKTEQTNSTGTNYYLDLNSIVHMQYQDLESFTIPVVREIDNGKLENLMISKNSEGLYTAKLLTYTLTTQEKNDLIVGNLKNIQHPIETELIEDFSTMSSVICGYSTVQVITSCGSGEHHAGNIGDWGSCKSKTPPSLKTITFAEYCDNGGGGDGGNYGNPFGDDGGGGGAVDSDFPTVDTPADDYEEGISEPTLSAEVDGTKPGPKLKRPFECLNDNHLAAIFPNSTAIDRARLILKIRAYGEYFGIDTKEELAHFLGQIGQETGGLTDLTPQENLNYSVQGLIDTWPSRFTSTPNHPTKELASEYANNPEKIANSVYANRMGNGNIASGHGWKYRARGVLQLTGRAGYYGYHQYLTSIGLGWFLTNVNDLADPADCTHSVLSGMWFFKTQALDKMTINANTNPDKVTEKVNYYTDKQSYLNRKNYTNAAKQHLPVCPTN